MSDATATWKDRLGLEKQQPYFKKILSTLASEREKGKTIYPAHNNIFNALKLTPYEKVKVVILGQDPYHGPQQAHGLSFSVLPGIKPPPSLVNIFEELRNDIGISKPTHGCLNQWAERGVLLLNACLTVEAGKPQSHANIGWQQFTDSVISSLNEHPEPIVFLLWGAYAQKKAALIDGFRHHILKAPHPSPLSAHRGFLGCHHFSKANQYLTADGRGPIDWSLEKIQ